MKKILFFVLSIFCLYGCSPTDEIILYDMVPITEVEIPETLTYGETYTFTIHYEKPNSCHVFDGFYIKQDVNEVVLGVVNSSFPEDENCEEEAVIEEATINFHVERNDFYIFKFWQGEDEDGEPIYLNMEVPVES